MIARLWFFVAVLGAGLFVQGALGFVDAVRAPTEPTRVEIAALERDERPDQPFVELGAHTALWFAARPIEFGRDRQRAGVLYPIVSADHRIAKDWRALERQHGSAADVPEHAFPRIEFVELFALERDFASRPDVPLGIAEVPSMSGMARSGSEFEGPELRALYELMHGTGPTEVLVVEKDAVPESAAGGVALMIAGVVVLAWAGMLFGRSRQEAGEAGS